MVHRHLHHPSKIHTLEDWHLGNRSTAEVTIFYLLFLPVTDCNASVYSCIFCGALPSRDMVFCSILRAPSCQVMSARGYIILYKMERVIETGHIKSQNLVEVEKSLNWRHHDSEMQGSQSVDETGVCFV